MELDKNGCCKTFSGKYIFSGNAIFRKRKIFPCVWLHFKKFPRKYFLVFGKEEGKHKSRKTQATTQEKIINNDDGAIAIDDEITISDRRDHDLGSSSLAVDRDLDPSRSRDGEIAINGAISPSDASPLARARSLSLILRKCCEGKIEV